MTDNEKPVLRGSADERTARYAQALGQMIRCETVSSPDSAGEEKFHSFRLMLPALFPALFGSGEYREFSNGFTLRWPGRNPEAKPVLFLNHHDVVEAAGEWRHPPFSGEIAEGRLWGRGTLDDKGGLWAMLQAADELAAKGFIPERTVWFFSSCTEETTGAGADEASRWFLEQGISFEMCLDEGGLILRDPIPGVRGEFAMIGVGEKGCADLKFIARSDGGHSSFPGKNTPLVRLGSFMAEVDKHRIFRSRMHPAICEMLRCFAPHCDGLQGQILAAPERHRALLNKALLADPRTAALLRTTVAFTMAGGSGGANVLPAEAWVIANMRFSHHQGQQGSFDAIRALAAKYDLEMEILDPGQPSRIADYTGNGYTAVSTAVKEVFPGTVPVPYLLTGASDSRFFDRVCDQCIRFLPFSTENSQLASIHGTNENTRLDSLSPAVDFYRCMMKGC